MMVKSKVKPSVRILNGWHVIRSRVDGKTHYVDGRKHRLDGPAYVGANGSKAWYVNGVCHRLDGPAVEGADGVISTRYCGAIHYHDGRILRTDGPVIEWADGRKVWYINGTQVDISLIDYDGSRPLTYDEITYLILAS